MPETVAPSLMKTRKVKRKMQVERGRAESACRKRDRDVQRKRDGD